MGRQQQQIQQQQQLGGQHLVTFNSTPSSRSKAKENRSATQPYNMTASTATDPTSGSQKTSPSCQKGTEKFQHSMAEDEQPVSDEPAPKRPKRTLKLTTSQRERKRAIDREAQRSIRLKTKNYIAHLENLVSIMENGGSTAGINHDGKAVDAKSVPENENERARDLLSQLRQSEEEIVRLKDMLSGVQRLINQTGIAIDESELQWLTLSASYNADSVTRARHSFQAGAQDSLESCASVYSHSSDSSTVAELAFRPQDPQNPGEAFAAVYNSGALGSQPYILQKQDVYNGTRMLSAPTARPERPTSEPADAPHGRDEADLFCLLDREINRVLAGGHQSFTNQPLDEDIVVRAVLHGWSDVQDEYLLDKGWQALRCIDQAIFREYGVVERMAILSMMRLKLLHQTNTNPQYLEPLPSFLERTPREDAEALKANPVIEIFVWPGLRACLCQNKRYINHKVADVFKRSFKFVWPFNTSDAYAKDYSTQLYSITPMFKQRQWDLRSWAMRRDFFAHASDLSGLIPVYDPPIERALVPARTTSIQATPSAVTTPQAMHRSNEVSNPREQKMEHPQPKMMRGSGHSPVPTARTVPTSAAVAPGMHAPFAAEVEAWLGDPEMVPQYWNMAPTMNMRYEAPPQQWHNNQGGYGG